MTWLLEARSRLPWSVGLLGRIQSYRGRAMSLLMWLSSFQKCESDCTTLLQRWNRVSYMVEDTRGPYGVHPPTSLTPFAPSAILSATALYFGVQLTRATARTILATIALTPLAANFTTYAITKVSVSEAMITTQCPAPGNAKWQKIIQGWWTI